jgi:hypothetical protein
VFREQDSEAIVEQVVKANVDLKKLGQKIGFDKKDDVLEATLVEVRKILDHKNLIAALGNKDMKTKHLTEIWKLLPDAPPTVDQFRLDEMISKGIENHVEAVETISAKATGESNILNTIDGIKEEWE